MLETNGLDPARVARVVGFADTQLYIKDQPKDPQNRRISIILLQPKEGAAVAEAPKDEIRRSFQEQTPPPAQPGQQAQSAASEPAVETAASKEQAARQSFQQKKAEMKKKKRDVMGLWE
jgi:chemotaxis protein MotB